MSERQKSQQTNLALYIDLFIIILLHSLNKSSRDIFNSEIVLLSTYPSTRNICKIAGSDTSSQFQDCLFPFLHFLSIFVCYQSASLICDNSADVCDAPLKVGSNVGWAVLARSGHKSHITTTLPHTIPYHTLPHCHKSHITTTLHTYHTIPYHTIHIQV